MHRSIQASLLAWNAQTVLLFFLHLCGHSKSDSSGYGFSGQKHAQAHVLVPAQLAGAACPPCCSSTVVMREKLRLGSWWLCRAQEVSSSEVTVSLFILPL